MRPICIAQLDIAAGLPGCLVVGVEPFAWVVVTAVSVNVFRKAMSAAFCGVVKLRRRGPGGCPGRPGTRNGGERLG